ncbi:CobW-like GTP-binding protein [Luminiphilus sp.]|nr:CobW-like GTP-binding protein [Luminiphilus sp.]
MPSKITAVNVIAGFLGAGKTSAIVGLLNQKPANESWAVIVNEFGEIGIDGSFLRAQAKDSNVIVLEVPGGVHVLLSSLFNGLSPKPNFAPLHSRPIAD